MKLKTLLLLISILMLFSCDAATAEDYLRQPTYQYTLPVFQRWHNEERQDEADFQREVERDEAAHIRTMEMLDREREQYERDDRHQDVLREQKRQADALERMADEMERR